MTTEVCSKCGRQLLEHTTQAVYVLRIEKPESRGCPYIWEPRYHESEMSDTDGFGATLLDFALLKYLSTGCLLEAPTIHVVTHNCL